MNRGAAATIAPITAIPSVPPTWRDVVSTPEATPARSTETVRPGSPLYGLQFVQGFENALETGAGIALAGAVLSALLIRRVSASSPSGEMAGGRGVGPLPAPEALAVGVPDPVGDDELLVR